MSRQTYREKLDTMSPAELEQEQKRNMRGLRIASVVFVVAMFLLVVSDVMRLLIDVHIIH